MSELVAEGHRPWPGPAGNFFSRRARGICFFVLLLALLVVDSLGEGKVIRLRNELILTGNKPAQALQAQGVEPLASGLFLIQFRDRIQPAWRAELAGLNVELLRSIPDDAFVARVSGVRLSRIKALPFVQWVGEYRAGHKLHAALRFPSAVNPDAEQDISVLVSPGAANVDLLKLRRSLVRVRRISASRFGTIVNATATRQQIAALAHSPLVLWIEPDMRPKLLDEAASKLIGGDDRRKGTRTLVQQLGFDGRGVTVAVADSGLDGGTANSVHPDLAGRVKTFFQYGLLDSAADEHGHGSHVSGLIAGDGSAGERDADGALFGLGIAPRAQIVVQRIFDRAGRYVLQDDDFKLLARDAVRAGAEIGSNSWGDDTQGRYDIAAAEFDALVRDADDSAPGDQGYFLSFAAGNSGPARQTVGTPAVAKNVVATGASQSGRTGFATYNDGPEAMADFSSRGPAEDGRIKPDLVAPGTWIASLQSSAASDLNAWLPISARYRYEGGSSQAGPQVAAAAAVFTQYYRETHTNATPSPALIKAALINSATDLDNSAGTAAVPNFDEGWGRVDLHKLIGSRRRYEYFDQALPLATGETFERRLFVAGADEPLKVTLTYTDVPGLPAAIPALVNDLNLEVVGPDGKVYRGNQFDGGQSVPNVAAFDSINNVEAVHIKTPLPGEYIIRVSGHNVVEDARRDTARIDQDFALVISGDLPSPGTGLVVLDRRAYGAPSQIEIKLIDFDLVDTESVSVIASSSTELAGEIVSLQRTGVAGVWTGRIATVTGSARRDGQLQVSHRDTVRVSYHDTSPPVIRTAVAEADLRPPVITNVVVANRFGKTWITWETDEPSLAAVRYGTNGTLVQIAATSALGRAHTIPLEQLLPGQPYRFVVVATDPAGNSMTDDNGGQFFGFTAQPAKAVLLVDAFNADSMIEPTPLSDYTDALDQTGFTYDVWNVKMSGLPKAADLRPYLVVIWRVAEFDEQTMLQPAEQAAIQEYVRGGGGFFMASMEALNHLNEAPFRREVLQVEEFKKDAGVAAVVGRDSDPITSRMKLDLDYSAYADVLRALGAQNLSDTIMPGTNAVPILFDTESGRPVGLRYPRTGADGQGRVVFLSFPFSAVPGAGADANNRVTLLRNILSFLAPGMSGIGTIGLDDDTYTVPARVTIEVSDLDRAGRGQLQVSCFTSSATQGQVVPLQETVHPGLFRGFVALAPWTSPTAPGRLNAKHGDQVWVEYRDESSRATLRASAVVDTLRPTSENVTAHPDYEEATVVWNTSKATDALVQFGESALLSRTAYSPEPSKTHRIRLTGLVPNRVYYFQVVNRDAAGNTVLNDNDRKLYSFRTLAPIVPPWTDTFDNGATNWIVRQGDLTSALRSGIWQFGPPRNGRERAAFSPPNAWGSNLGGEIIDASDTLLLSPALDLTRGNEAILRFRHSYDFLAKSDLDVFESGHLYVYSDGGKRKTLVAQYLSRSQGWELAEVDLSAHAGKVIRLGWHYAQRSFGELPRPGWLLDDVSVTLTNVVRGTLVITNNLSQASFTISGPVTRTGSGWGLVLSNAPAGRYVVTYGDVPFYRTPPPQAKTLSAPGPLEFFGKYTFADVNSNGISDAWEEFYFQSVASNRPPTLDSDRDGYSDYAEFTSGTDPTNARSRLRVLGFNVMPDGTTRLLWSSVPGYSYRVLATTNPLTWTPFSGWIRATSHETAVALSGLVPGKFYFYQIEVQP